MRQTNQFEREKQNKKNGAFPGLIILLILFIFPMLFSRTVIWQLLNILILPALVLAILGFCIGMRLRKGRGKDAERNYSVPFRSVSPGAGKTCPNPETHRHYETRKSCPNPEPHKHYSSGVSRPLTQIQQDEAARKKRLENMRVLYDAGILTREEYDYEVRRIKNL